MNFNLDFLRFRFIALIASVSFILVSLATISIQQLQLGLDFTGGTLVEVGFSETVDPEEIRTYLEGKQIDALVQAFGSDKDLLIKIPSSENIENANIVIDSLQQQYSFQLRRSGFVGPQVGGELRDQGGLGLLAALLVMMIYIMFRFQYKFAIGAVVALFHDVLIVLGIFSILRLEFDLSVLAALMAVIGYSLNDTIVVSDRIRENFRAKRKLNSEQVINRSLNNTLGRTLITSLTTLLVLFSLLFLGGEIIRNFAIALSIGVVVGTYSSIYVLTNVLLSMNITADDLAERTKDSFDDGMP
ncbi:MAG: protein translocase subunit SecF [Gammaproteobacteria bacterium]|jgi:preprotein translocase subunit SecF|nr:protein translocase subunit SecF [SAR86 cluster bacterium]GIR52017.1 MAG: protein-export membrane protein SecF [Gammaproteobacteria bacterium]|tara:strand:- start:165 stop:1067 length:903 start_codon:yes stop_codon:yes gene_type:complete